MKRIIKSMSLAYKFKTKQKHAKSSAYHITVKSRYQLVKQLSSWYRLSL